MMFGFCAGRDRKFGVSLGLWRVDAAWSRDLSCGIPYECGECESRVDIEYQSGLLVRFVVITRTSGGCLC